MLTPDAYPIDDRFVEKLTAPLRRGDADVAYGRQLARPEADLLERMDREFNYPTRSHLRSLNDWPAYGGYTHFCSNVCAAWSNAALDVIGGFKPTLVSEETVAVAELLARGARIAYVAEAAVVHSHPQTTGTGFRRHFDIGYSRRLYADLLLARERDEVRGWQIARTALAQARREAPSELPRLAARLAARWLGYRIGLIGPSLPRALARRLSGQDHFWTSELMIGGPGAVASV